MIKVLLLCLFPVTQLSWTVRVTTSEISADLEWDDFPLGVSITQYYVRFTDQKDNVSVLLPVNGHDKHYSLHTRPTKPLASFPFGARRVSEKRRLQSL